jgi:hypothetical protein
MDADRLKVRDGVVQVFGARPPVPGGLGNDVGDVLQRQAARVERAPTVDHKATGPERASVGPRCKPARRSARWLHDELASEQSPEGCRGLLSGDAEDHALALAAAVQRHHKAGQVTGATKAGHPDAERAIYPRTEAMRLSTYTNAGFQSSEP